MLALTLCVQGAAAAGEALVFQPPSAESKRAPLCADLLCGLGGFANRSWVDGGLRPTPGSRQAPPDALAVLIGNALAAIDRPEARRLALTPYSGAGPHGWGAGATDGGSSYKRPIVDAGVLAQLAMTRHLLIGAQLGGSSGEAQLASSRLPLGNASLTELGLSVDYVVDRHWHVRLALRRAAFRYGSLSVASFDFSGWQSPSSLAAVQDQIFLGLAYTF